jgi:hypothetical protein
LPLPSRSESSRERLPPVSCARTLEHVGAGSSPHDVAILRSSSFLGDPVALTRAPRPSPFLTPSTPLDGPTKRRFPRLSRTAPTSPRGVAATRARPAAGSRSLAVPCACAPNVPRFPGLTPDLRRSVRDTSSSRRMRPPPVQGSETRIGPTCPGVPARWSPTSPLRRPRRDLGPRTSSGRSVTAAFATVLARPGPQRVRQATREPSSRRSGRLAVPRAHRTAVAGSYPARIRKAAFFHGVCCPSAHAEAGSDLYRGCLPRLRGVLGLSRPLDALLHPSPFRPCFMPVTPLGFPLSEGFPPW